MTDERIFTVRKMANQLFALESSIDATLGEAAQLTAALPQARVAMKASAVVGQDVFDRSVDVVSALTAARRAVVELHAALDAAKDQLGIRTLAFGGGMIKPGMPRHATSQRAGLAA